VKGSEITFISKEVGDAAINVLLGALHNLALIWWLSLSIRLLAVGWARIARRADLPAWVGTIWIRCEVES
jgi:hypothetical protein